MNPSLSDRKIYGSERKKISAGFPPAGPYNYVRTATCVPYSPTSQKKENSAQLPEEEHQPSDVLLSIPVRQWVR